MLIFPSKMSNAYKESLETKYWLSLMKATDYITENIFESMFTDADEISKMLFSITKKSRLKKTVD